MKRLEWRSAAARRIVALAGNVDDVRSAVQVVAARFLEGIDCAPTDLISLGRRLNVSAINPVAGLPYSGQLRKVGKTLVVEYSASMAPGRRRFTIAHEFGHAVFESTGPNCPRSGRELERLCDMLASEFVFPRECFLERAKGFAGPISVFQLAREFDASLMATAARCRSLLNANVFQVSKGRVTWGYGAVRSQNDLSGDEDAIRLAISRAMDGETGEACVYLGSASYALRWASSPGQSSALFTAHPIARVRATYHRDQV